jgi:hypothetical protein
VGFIFRTIFWLALALVVLPPQARLGGGAGTGDVAWQDIDVAFELHNAAYAAWSWGVDALSSCDTNPELCKTAVDLWDTTVATTQGLRAELNDGLKEATVGEQKLAENEHRSAKKIQARVE